MNKYACGIVAILSLVTGCQSTPPPPLQSKFNAQQARYAIQHGTGSIVGQAFMRQRGGGVVTAAGSDVILVPDQTYTRELTMRDISGRGFLTAEYVPVYPYTRQTIADASGSFSFSGLAAGDYIVLTEVKWTVPTEYGGINQGGTVASPVTVQEGQTSRVILR